MKTQHSYRQAWRMLLVLALLLPLAGTGYAAQETGKSNASTSNMRHACPSAGGAVRA